jgi:hypothetical protein
MVAMQKNGSDLSLTYQENWNVDRVDGSENDGNPTGLTLDLNRGNILQIEYSWYGYGSIAFQAVLPDATLGKRQRVATLHTLQAAGSTTIIQPNLPIRVEVTNGDQSTDYDLFVAGRQYSIIGKFDPNRRIVANTITDQALDAGSGFEHVMSFRRKSTGSFESISAKIAFLQFIIDQSAIVRIKTGATLTAASWGNPSGSSGNADETAVEVDTSATVAGGVILTEFLIEGGLKKESAGNSLFGDDFNFDLIGLDPITLEVDILVDGTLNAATFALREEW